MNQPTVADEERYRCWLRDARRQDSPERREAFMAGTASVKQRRGRKDKEWTFTYAKSQKNLKFVREAIKAQPRTIADLAIVTRLDYRNAYRYLKHLIDNGEAHRVGKRGRCGAPALYAWGPNPVLTEGCDDDYCSGSRQDPRREQTYDV